MSESKKPKRKVKASTLLAKAAKEAGWDEEIQLTYLAGFLAERGKLDVPEGGVAAFVENVVSFAASSKASLGPSLSGLCGVADDADLSHDFGNYLQAGVAEFLAEVRRGLDEAAAAKAEAVKLESSEYHSRQYEPSEVFEFVEPMLNQPGSLEEFAFDELILGWSFPFPGGLSAEIQVRNGEPVYLDACLVLGTKVVDSLIPSLALERTFEFNHGGQSYKVSFHRQ